MPGGGSQIGAIAITEGGDIFAGLGAFLASGSMADTEGHDVSGFAGSCIIGSIGVSDGADHSGFAGSAVVFGSMAISAANDSPSISGVDTAFGSITLVESIDTPAGAGMFTASGSIAKTEAHDLAALVGGFLTAGSLSVTEGHDTPVLPAISGSLGTTAITEAADTPSISALFTAQASTGVGGLKEAHDAFSGAGSLTVTGSMGATERHDTAFGFEGGLEYHVYSDTGIGDPINYGSPIATTGLLEWTSSPLAFPATWRFGVRAFDPVTMLEEENLDCSITLILDAGGNDITNRPIAPTHLRAFPTAGGGVRVEWAYNTINPKPVPTGFHVYKGTGGLVSYAAPVATVSFAASVAGTFVANLPGLSNGVAYTIGVRAYNGTAEESNTNTVTATADASGPAAVVSLTAIAVV